MRPIIGVTCASSPGPNYLQALEACGADGVALVPGSPLTEAAVRDPSAAGLHGILFTGGVDVAPRRYGAAQVHPTTDVDDVRDEVEIPLAQAALRGRVPVLGVCRGIQLLNVAVGGTLWQDLPSECPSTVVHMDPPATRDRSRRLHTVRLAPGTRLAEIVGDADLPVNSIHHQAVRTAAAPFVITAQAPDGVVEAMEATGPGFAVMVQWHPEDLWRDERRHQALFIAFVQAARAQAAI